MVIWEVFCEDFEGKTIQRVNAKTKKTYIFYLVICYYINQNKNEYKNGLTFAPMLHLPFPPPTGISFLRRLGYPFLYRVYFLSLRHSYRGCCDSAKIYRRSYKRNILDQVGPRD